MSVTAITSTSPEIALRADLQAIVERLTLLTELYHDDTPPNDVNGESYLRGFHAGVRSSYTHAIVEIREALAR